MSIGVYPLKPPTTNNSMTPLPFERRGKATEEETTETDDAVEIASVSLANEQPGVEMDHHMNRNGIKKGFQERERSFAHSVTDAVLGAQLVQTAYIGYKLGWYDALRDAGTAGLNSTELGAQTKTSERYAREWLEQHAVGAWLECLNPNDSYKKRRFVLPAAHVNVLANPESDLYMLPRAVLTGGIGKSLDQLVEAYKNDTGVSWDDFGNDARTQQGAMNRPFFMNHFASVLENQILDTKTLDKLRNHKGRVADIGSGYGWSSIAVAKHFPQCTVDGFDLDEVSVDTANDLSAKEGLSDRVKAHCQDAGHAADLLDFKPYDLVMALECIHDLSDPISVLQTMLKLSGRSGTVLLLDKKVANDFAGALLNRRAEQGFYGFSCTLCLSDGKSREPSAATGSCMRPFMLRAYAQQAGFREIEVMDFDHETFRFYRLHPH